ncbi:MAG: phosphonate transport system permease protein, partial [Gammaproteobacteria bacterium]
MSTNKPVSNAAQARTAQVFAAQIRPTEAWAVDRVVTPKMVGLVLLTIVALAFSAKHTELDKAVMESGQAINALVTGEDSRVVSGAANFIEKAFPFHLSSRLETNRIENLDRDALPWLSRIEIIDEREYDALTDTFSIVRSEYLVRPVGYVTKVLVKMWETIEMAFWGTALAMLLALPLAFFGARNYAPHVALYQLARWVCSFNRAMPELILALFFVLMYGFGPIAGVLALGLHTSGFLGKFFADDIENADPGPQHALRSNGSGKLKVLRY